MPFRCLLPQSASPPMTRDCTATFKYICEWSISCKCQISQNAADIALHYQSSHIGLAIEKLRQGLQTVINWLDKNHNKIIHAKSNFLLFTNKKNSEDLTLTIRSQIWNIKTISNCLGWPSKTNWAGMIMSKILRKKWKQNWFYWTN